MDNNKKQKRKRYRSAISGKVVTKEFAIANPDTTVAETVWLTPKTKVEPTAEGEENKNTENN